VDNSPKAPNDSAKRIENLNNHFTLSLYENVCRSLFEVNKLMFSLVLCAQILFGFKALDPIEWRFFLAGPSGSIEPKDNPTEWLDDLVWGDVWKQLVGMSKLPTLAGFDQFFLDNQAEFQRIFDSPKPEDEPIPGEWNDKLDYFQKMIVIKAIRQDKVPFAIQNFVAEKIGKQYIIPPTFSI
jgi:dynein heavy chain